MRVLESEAKVSDACAGAQDKLLELAALETELSAACAEAQDMMLGMAAVGESSSFAKVSDVCGEAQDMLSRLSAQRFQAVSSAKRYQSKIHDAQSLICRTKCRSWWVHVVAVSTRQSPAPADGAGLDAPPPTQG
jgi:hypothetical protein